MFQEVPYETHGGQFESERHTLMSFKAIGDRRKLFHLWAQRVHYRERLFLPWPPADRATAGVWIKVEHWASRFRCLWRGESRREMPGQLLLGPTEPHEPAWKQGCRGLRLSLQTAFSNFRQVAGGFVPETKES